MGTETKLHHKPSTRINRKAAPENHSILPVNSYQKSNLSPLAFQSLSFCPCEGACPKCIGSSDYSEIIQTKLKISKPSDPFEKEADRIAEQVLQMPASQSIDPSTQSEKIDPKNTSFNMEYEKLLLKKEEVNIDKARKTLRILSFEKDDEDTDKIKKVYSGSGFPLDNNTKDLMESKFGYDFSNIRIHNDTKAAELADSVNALAFTLGKHIVFGHGQYLPHTISGQKLLAHELMHTIQQQYYTLPGSHLIQRQPARPGYVRIPISGEWVPVADPQPPYSNRKTLNFNPEGTFLENNMVVHEPTYMQYMDWTDNDPRFFDTSRTNSEAKSEFLESLELANDHF